MENDRRPHELFRHGFYGQPTYDANFNRPPERRMNRLMAFGLGFAVGLILDGMFINKIPGTTEELAVGLLVPVGSGIAGIVVRNNRYMRRG